MISVSGNDWAEEKFNNRLTNKIKIENNFSLLLAGHILFKK
tara:strand:- start:630 stop:752 length:123 start_codon:yes stop_codon:yes gene_type:complete